MQCMLKWAKPDVNPNGIIKPQKSGLITLHANFSGSWRKNVQFEYCPNIGSVGDRSAKTQIFENIPNKITKKTVSSYLLAPFLFE